MLRLEKAMKEDIQAMRLAEKHALKGAGMEISGGPLENRVRKADRDFKNEQEQFLKV